MAVCPVMSKEGKEVQCIQQRCTWWLLPMRNLNPIGQCVVYQLAFLVHEAGEKAQAKQ